MLEIACFELTSAEIALNSVADRIEFCTNGHLGGTTPDTGELAYLKSKYKQPIYVMIRPSGGDFAYSKEEFEQMKKDISAFSKAGADGFVFGILTPENKIDAEKCRTLIALAEGKPCTFHRAFDYTPDLNASMDILIDSGFQTVLTSGGQPSAMEGKETLKRLIETYAERINILIGGGVRSSNIAELKRITKGNFFHSSAILKGSDFADEEEIKQLKKHL